MQESKKHYQISATKIVIPTSKIGFSLDFLECLKSHDPLEIES